MTAKTAADTAHRKSLLARRGRAAAGWTVVSFLAVQLAFGFVMDRVEPALRDPEYGRKLALLKEKLSQAPQKPLVLILGSSRSGVGLLPGKFRADELAESGTLVFNFALTGSGPVRELMTLRRLLAEGIRPDKALIEVHPLLLHGDGGFGELAGLDASRLDWADLHLASRYLRRPALLRADWFRARLAPCFAQRFCLLHRFAPTWLAANSPLSIWNHLDPWGGLTIELPATSQSQFDERLATSLQEYAPAFDRYHITRTPDRALRDLLEICHAEGIDAALYLMPEEKRFAAAYPSEARAEIESYLASLAREYGCLLFDATQWCETADFCDGHHLLAAGAEHFSERFDAQVVQTLLALKSPPATFEGRQGAAIARRNREDQPPPLR